MIIKKYIKISFLLFLIIALANNVFAYNILIDAVCEDSTNNTCSSVTYLETMGAYKKSKSYYNGQSVTYPIPTNTYVSSNLDDVSWTGISTFGFSGSNKTISATLTNGYVLRSNNPDFYAALPDYYSIGSRTLLFHKNPGTTYGSSGIKVGYESYTIDSNGNIDSSSIRDSTAYISAGNPNFICHEPNTEYQYKIVGELYYSYNRIHITDTMLNNLEVISTPSDDGIAYGGRLYMSKSELTKSDAYSFSSSHNQYDVNKNTAFELLSMSKFWESVPNGGWGSTSTSGYKVDANGNQTDVADYAGSAVNLYDNVIQLGTKRKSTREIYINHIYIKNNIDYRLDTYANTYENMIVPSGTRNSTASTYQEHYTIVTGETIQIRKSDKENTKVGEYTYQYSYGEEAVGDTLAQAQTYTPGNTWTSPTKNYTTNSSGTDDCVIINLVYKRIPPIIVGGQLKALELTGRLEFINQLDPSYSTNTQNANLDYVPSTSTTSGRLTPYAQSAYPYVVRALRYEINEIINNATATVTVTQPYSYEYWQWVSYPNPAPSGPTGYYQNYTGYGSLSKTYTYTIPYRYTWFDLVNLKIYRISKLEVYDNNNNIGGTLFGGGTYTITPSTAYDSRFNNSSGKIDSVVNVSFPSKSYSLSSIYKSATSPGSGQSDAIAAAQTALNAVTAKSAADTTNLTVTYAYDNDYVQLDGFTDMLVRNYKTWSEHINTEINSERLLNSTLSGTGQVNGSMINYTTNLLSFIKPARNLTSKNDFADNYQIVPALRENGIRELKGKIYYSLVTDPKYNVGTDLFNSTDATDKIRNSYPDEFTGVGPQDLGVQTKDYVDDATKNINDVNKINVLTPISFGNFNIITTQKVDHTEGAGSYAILQKNADFTITPITSNSTTAGYNFADTREFIRGYYYIFDFDVIYNGNTISAYTPIYVAGASTTFTGKTTTSFSSGAAAQLSNSIKITAITTNITDALVNVIKDETFSDNTYKDPIINTTKDLTTQNQPGLLSRADIKGDAYHAIWKTIYTKNVGRIFDFAVTDCTDLAFKDVFRNTASGNVNEPTGISYYSGYKYWNLYSTQYNEMLDRPNIGVSPELILPLGPYKNTDTRYINAPKMGYRISFDLKTTGFMAANNANNTRRVEITPSYYYISKDGKTFDNNIKLYYMNSSSNYAEFANSGYTIYYKPNDGYRYLRNSAYTDDFSMMSTKLEPLDISSKLILTNKTMSTNNTSFIQAWYGEFKLPNSTIAISNIAGNVNNNINNPYTDGYIGVVFDIKCIDTGGFTLSYNTSDKAATSQTNTSEWDYEGYMNFKTPGSVLANPMKYQLEKDAWTIDDNMYQKIKGTVVLFDLDNRASSDFE